MIENLGLSFVHFVDYKLLVTLHYKLLKINFRHADQEIVKTRFYSLNAIVFYWTDLIKIFTLINWLEKGSSLFCNQLMLHRQTVWYIGKSLTQWIFFFLNNCFSKTHLIVRFNQINFDCLKSLMHSWSTRINESRFQLSSLIGCHSHGVLRVALICIAKLKSRRCWNYRQIWCGEYWEYF